MPAAAAVVVLALSRNRVLSGIVAYALLPLAAAVRHRSPAAVLSGGLMALVVVLAHLRRPANPVPEGA